MGIADKRSKWVMFSQCHGGDVTQIFYVKKNSISEEGFPHKWPFQVSEYSYLHQGGVSMSA